MFHFIKSIYYNYTKTYHTTKITKKDSTINNNDLDPFYFNYLHNFFIIY